MSTNNPPTTPTTLDPAPWERQADESPQAWEAFALYRDMGNDRSLSKVATSLEKSPELMGRWSSGHSWVARALAYDVWKDRATQALRESSQARLLEEHLSEGEKLRQAGIRLLDDRPPEGRRKKPTRPTSADVVRAAETVREGQHLQRLALGMPTNITKTQVEFQKAVDEALAAQAALTRIIEEHLQDDGLCEHCSRIAAELERVHHHQERARAYIGPI
jgi:hypothetical protein